MKENQALLHKNLQLYSIYSAFTNLLILGPILTLYLLYRGLTFTQILSLQSVAAITVTVMEVPTGAVGDLLGRKKSLIIGTFAMLLALLIYGFGNHYIYYIAAEILFSLGMSFKSGSDTALIFDTLKELKRVDDFKNVIGKGQFYALVAQIPGSILAGYAYELDYRLPFIISAVFMLITLLIELQLTEVQVFAHQEKPKYRQQIKESFSMAWRIEKVRAVILYTMGFYIFFRISYWVYQPYFKAVDIPVIYFGYIFAGFNLVAAIASKRSPIFIERTKGWTLIGLSVLMIISFLGAGLIHSWIGILLLCIQQYIRGIYKPSVMKYINKHIESEQRATIISIQSLMSNLVVALLMPLAGWIIDKVDIFTANLIFAGALSLITFMSHHYLKQKMGPAKIRA